MAKNNNEDFMGCGRLGYKDIKLIDIQPLNPGMTVMVDVSFFVHPELFGGRIETGFIITENGSKPMSPKMFERCSKDL